MFTKDDKQETSIKNQKDKTIQQELLRITFDHKYFTILWAIYFAIRKRFSYFQTPTYHLHVSHCAFVVLDYHSHQSIQYRRDAKVYRYDLGFHRTHFENYPLVSEADGLIWSFSRIHFWVVHISFQDSFCQPYLLFFLLSF